MYTRTLRYSLLQSDPQQGPQGAAVRPYLVGAPAWVTRAAVGLDRSPCPTMGGLPGWTSQRKPNTACVRWVRGQVRHRRRVWKLPQSSQVGLFFQKTDQTDAEPMRSQYKNLLGSSKTPIQGGAGLRSVTAACTLGFRGRFGGIGSFIHPHTHRLVWSPLKKELSKKLSNSVPHASNGAKC